MSVFSFAVRCMHSARRAIRRAGAAGRRITLALALLGSGAAGAAAQPAQPIPVSFDSSRWVISQRNFKLTQTEDESRNGEELEHLGRRSLRVSKGLFYARGLEFQNGTIEVDMAPGPSGRFLGIAFRVQSDDEYEVIFFRPGASGTSQAIQYTPGLRGANAWQVYTGPGYTAEATIERNKWTHVRLVVSGLVAQLYLNHASEPALVVPDLKQGHSRGSIGFWGHMGDAFYSNLTYTPDITPVAATPEPQKFLAGALADWQLSEIFDVAEKDPSRYPDTARMKWEAVGAENPGMVVINRYRRSPNILPPEREEHVRGREPGAQFVFARTTIRSEREEVRRMRFTYSDKIVIFLNGWPLYSGNNTLSFRQSNYLGLLDPDSDAVYLPLRRGENELILAVTEFFGGWAFLCQLAP